LAQSLARPGGNLTGVTELATELSAKRLEILKEGAPAPRQTIPRRTAVSEHERRSGPAVFR